MKKYILIISLLIGSCIWITGFAQDSIFTKKITARKISRYGFTFDQDFLLHAIDLNEDRNYTSGVALFLGNNRWPDRCLFKPFKWVAKKTYCGLAKKLFKPDKYNIERSATLTVGVSAFTPEYLGDNIDSLYYTINDRPFSSLTFVSASHQMVSLKKVESNRIVVGILGLGIAREVQTEGHEEHWFGSTRAIPDGWKYQVSDGGELTFLVSNRADILLNDKKSFDTTRIRRWKTQFIISREYRLGYYTGISGGAAIRLGFLDQYNWPLYDAYQLNYANAIGENRKLLRELYLQASLKPHIVLYNAHLQGQLKKKKYDYITYPPIEHLVVEGFAGIGATIPNCNRNFSVNLLAYISGRTAEIKSPLSRNHVWGGVQVSFTRIKP